MSKRMWLDIEQNTEDWQDKRKGRITSSQFSVIMANTVKAKGVFIPEAAMSDRCTAYVQQKALERVTGKRKEDDFYNKNMENGHCQIF